MYDIEEQIDGLSKIKSLDITRDVDGGIVIMNNDFDTRTHVTFDALKNNDIDTIFTQTAHGKDVEKITRITGYFSPISNWNKGKIAELQDRTRVGRFFSDAN